MKKLKKEGTIYTITFMLGVLAFFAVGLSMLALMDIYQDYVSPEVLQKEGVTLSKELPAWSRCSQEWNALRYSYLVLIAFFVFLIINWLKKI